MHNCEDTVSVKCKYSHILTIENAIFAENNEVAISKLALIPTATVQINLTYCVFSLFYPEAVCIFVSFRKADLYEIKMDKYRPCPVMSVSRFRVYLVVEFD